MRARATGLVLCALSIAASTPATPEEIRVSGRVQRPVWFQGAARDRFMQSTLSWAPASFQMARVYQPRRLGDLVVGKIYCGTVWTDSNGEFDEELVCGDGNLPDQLYLEVWGHSSRGFTVGAFDRVKFDLEMVVLGGAAALGALFVTVGTFGAGAIAAAATATGVGADAMLNLLDRAPAPYLWVTQVYNVSGDNFAFPGQIRLGRGRTGSTADSDDYAAAVMEGLDHAHAELVSPLPGTMGAPRLPPWGWSYWVINNPYFGTPTTIWDKVHINPGVINEPGRTFAQNLDSSWRQNMRSLVHELGHVVYNLGHSNKNHYLDPNEALHYARNHDNCRTQVSEKFGQYEGFAEAVSQIVWRDPVYDVAAPATCYTEIMGAGGSYADVIGFHTEGNAADFYTSMIHGFGAPRGATTLHDYTPVRQGANDVFLPPLDALLAMPKAAGPASHSVSAMWTNYWRARCEQPAPSATPLLCGTERFRCWVAETSELAPVTELPASFQGLSCGPSPVAGITVTTTKAGAGSSRNDVAFEGVDHAERYEVKIRRPPGGTVVRAPETTNTSATDIELLPCERHSVEVHAVNTFGTADGTQVEFTPGTQAVCGPTGPSVVSAVHTHDAADVIEARLEHMEVLRPAEDDEQMRAPETGPERRIEQQTVAAGPPTGSIVEQLTKLLSGGKRCYRIELAQAARADRYSIRYRAAGASSDGETTEGLVIPDRVHSVCLEGGQNYIVNGVGHNEYSTTPGPDFALRVPYRLEVAQVKGRVIPRLPPP